MTAENAAGRKSETTGTRESKRALIVDDEAENLRLFTEIIKGLGLSVSVHDSGREALSVVRDGASFDLVITDFRMPGMNGIQFVEELRGMIPDVPVIMLTAFGDIDTYFKAFSLGIFEYVNKPVDVAELRRIVRAALKQPGAKNGRAGGNSAGKHPAVE